MLLQAAMFLLGTLAVLLCPHPLDDAAAMALLAVALLACVSRRSLAVAFLCLGAVIAQGAVSRHQAGWQHATERLLVDARVLGIPRLTTTGLQFDAQLTSARSPQGPVQHARLTWRTPTQPLPRAGDHWRLAVQLAPPRTSYNPASVDGERNYLRDHVQATGTVLASALNRRLSASRTLDALRQSIAERILDLVQDPASAALLAALAVGATGDVSREQWRVFNATGITHLIAISGLHVTLFAMLAMAAARRVWSLAVRLGLRARRERFAAVAGLALATGYSLLAGFSVPTQRTLLMLGLWLLWRAAARSASGSSAVALAAVVVIVLDPFCVLSAGFWLSFLAVCSIIWIAGGRVLPSSKLRGAALVQFAVSVALLPVTFAIFGSLSLAGLVVNVAAIPLFSFVLVPVVLGATAALLCLPFAAGSTVAAWLLAVAEQLANHLLPWLARVADSNLALWWATPGLVWYALAAPAVALALLPWAPALRLTAALCVLPLLGARNLVPQGGLHATIFDVGDATAILLQTRHHSLLYGTGDRFGSRGGEVERAIVPFARTRDIRRLDVLFAGRLNVDTSHGVLVADAMLSPLQVFATAAGSDPLPPELRPCTSSDAWQWDGVSFEILATSTDESAAGAAPCVLRVAGRGFSLLVPGDADEKVEQALLERGLGRIDALVVPRRAAAAASSPRFLQTLQPAVALASIGRSALSRDSVARVRARYEAVGADWFDTASAGALHLVLQPDAPPRVRASRTGRLGVWSQPAADALP